MMGNDKDKWGRETTPFQVPAGSTASGQSNIRARVCVSFPSGEAWVAIRHNERSFSIPLKGLSSLLDELTEAHRVAFEHGLIMEAGDGVS